MQTCIRGCAAQTNLSLQGTRMTPVDVRFDFLRGAFNAFYRQWTVECRQEMRVEPGMLRITCSEP